MHFFGRRHRYHAGGIAINPELSRRALKITRTDAYVNLSPEDRQRFIREIESVNRFEELPDKCKDILKAGEREMEGY
ncbi:MAG: hypothetical protein A4E28_01503 [Methanocella sp. PtaU1.Bin125]|nr:MAG: hypothetical protein A4E28_01503 [Methanocella sp. PtaU1.Bin125]